PTVLPAMSLGTLDGRSWMTCPRPAALVTYRKDPKEKEDIMLQRLPFFLTCLAAIVTAIAPLPASIGVAAAATGSCAPLPTFSASNFAHDNGKPADIDNPYFPLVPGTTFVYLGTKDGEETKSVMRVTHTVKMI